MGNGMVKSFRLVVAGATWTASLVLLVIGGHDEDAFMVMWGLWLAFPSAVLTGWAILVVERVRAAAIVQAVLARTEGRDGVRPIR